MAASVATAYENRAREFDMMRFAAGLTATGIIGFLLL
jgi:hypothetical protein